MGRLLPASRCPPTVGKLIHSSPPALAHLRAGVGQLRTLTCDVGEGRIRSGYSRRVWVSRG